MPQLPVWPEPVNGERNLRLRGATRIRQQIRSFYLDLQVEPAQARRLGRIARNLSERTNETRTNGWLGKVKRLQVSLDAPSNKIASLERQRAAARTLTLLGFRGSGLFRVLRPVNSATAAVTSCCRPVPIDLIPAARASWRRSRPAPGDPSKTVPRFFAGTPL